MSIILALKTDGATPILRGSAHMWSVIRELTDKDRAQTFSAGDVLARTTRTELSTVRKWLSTLVRAGLLEALPDGAYRCLRRPVLLPQIGGDGRIVPSGQQAIWNAIRTLVCFGVREVAAVAATEETPVAPATAARYVRALADAGYFVVEQAGAPGRPARYRLKPVMRKRPLAPRILRTKIVYDPNINAVVGECEAEEACP